MVTKCVVGKFDQEMGWLQLPSGGAKFCCIASSSFRCIALSDREMRGPTEGHGNRILKSVVVQRAESERGIAKWHAKSGCIQSTDAANATAPTLSELIGPR